MSRNLRISFIFLMLVKLSMQQEESASEVSRETGTFYVGSIKIPSLEDDSQSVSEMNDSLGDVGPAYFLPLPTTSPTIDVNDGFTFPNVEDSEEKKTHRMVLRNIVGSVMSTGKKSFSDNNNTTEKLFHPYRYTVVILRKGAVFANGALVSDRLILTAAGPFYNVGDTLRLFRARLGSLDFKTGGKLMPLKSVEVHPSYEPGKPDFDVALLQLAMPVENNEVIEPTGLTRMTSVKIEKFLTSYWPRMIIDGKPISPFAPERLKYNRMRVSLQSMVPWNECSEDLRKRNVYLDDSSLCLKPPVTHHSVCMPDVGAPIVAEDGLWGVTSGWVVDNCTQAPSPVIFSKITTPVVNYWLELRMLKQGLM